jgi:molybdopterin biosynthesis enzyme MoaB
MSHGSREPGELGAAVLTISTSRARGEADDGGGPTLARVAESLGVVSALCHD